MKPHRVSSGFCRSRELLGSRKARLEPYCGRKLSPVPVVHPRRRAGSVALLQSFHLPRAEIQKFRRLPDPDPSLHCILDYLDSLQLLLAQCHSLLSVGG